jgi:Zn-dependent protease with chaperone function
MKVPFDAIKPLVALVGLLCVVANSAFAFSLISKEEENKLGEETYQEILKKEKLCQDREVVEFVERVAKRIQAVAPEMGFKYEISVLDSPIVNAFCLPGGKICVYTGILPYCKNEGGLATVISHEVAHAILRHGGQRMTQGTIVNAVGGGLSKVIEAKGAAETTEKVVMGAYGYGTQLGILLPYSRSQEIEADTKGLLYIAKAGYDPKEAPEFWKRFSVLKASTPSFLSTHPDHAERIKRLEKALPQARKLYDTSEKLGAGKNLPERCLTIPQETTANAADVKQAVATTENKPVAATADATQGKEGKLEKQTTSGKGAVQAASSLAHEEIKKGLQTALANGFKSAIAVLGKKNGFLGDDLVKIVMPEKLTAVEKAARALGKGKSADEFVQQMNRAAEKAVPGTAEVLAAAVAGLTLDDARNILNGPENAATEYFKRTCRDSLEEQILPVVKKATENVGVAGSYKNLVKKAGSVAGLLVGDFDLDGYITGKAVDGLFIKIADEEKRIRENPAGQAADILQKVFGSLRK